MTKSALIDDFARCAHLAQQAGYDGVEVMGSEGYLINEFLAARTNQREDEWGGDYARRMRFAVEVVRAVRERVGRDFIVIYRLSMLDTVEGGGVLRKPSNWRTPLKRRARPSSTPVSAGTKPVSRPLPPRCRVRHSVGLPAS